MAQSRARFHLQQDTSKQPIHSPTSPLSPRSPTSLPPPTPHRMPSLSTRTTTTATSATLSPSPSPSPYLDPYTTVAEGYQSRWRALITKITNMKRRKSVSQSLEAREATRVTLTERNLTQFFNPEFRNEVDAFRDPSTRVNPYNNRGKRERVGEWIRGLP